MARSSAHGWSARAATSASPSSAGSSSPGAGGHVNTDAIDNSAGVDTSDHEVNLKILLGRAVAAGRITEQERNKLLADATEDVAAHVLRHNYDQNVLLGMARMLSPALVSVHQRFMQTPRGAPASSTGRSSSCPTTPSSNVVRSRASACSRRRTPCSSRTPR